MRLQVRVSGRAERDVDVIFEWISKRSADGAARWYAAYLESLRSLPNQAANCATAPEADGLAMELRQILFRTRKGSVYRTLFIIRDSVIYILGVRGQGQNLVTAEDLGLPE